MELINKETKSTSRKRLQQLEEEEKQISNAFRISNFYKQHKLDLDRLKNKIQQVRLRKSNYNKHQYQSVSIEDQQPKPIQRNIISRQQNDTRQSKRVPTPNYHNPESRLSGQRNVRIRSGYSTFEDPISSRVKDRFNVKLQPILKSKIIVQREQELNKFQVQIQQIWSLYELLSKVMQGVQSYPFSQQMLIIKYVDDVCSDKFEFITDLLDRINPRYHKTVIMSRLLQNMAIIYLVIDLCKQKKIRSTHLVNFIGFCTSNLIFMIRLYTMHHELKLSPSNCVTNILQNINKFQLESYKGILTSQRQVIIRMQHNNQTINIIQVKLSQNSSKQFQSCVDEFLKHVQRNQQPLFEYAHYIFEFLAYFFHKQKIIGILPYLEIAPTPYLTLTFPQTVIIQPWQVLFFQKSNKLYIRAHTQQFIQQLSKICNVVIWSDMMPNQADPLFNLLPKANNIYFLYRYHCKLVKIVLSQQKNNYIKLIWRLGSLKDNAIIIDRIKDNFIYDIDVGIQLPWRGQKRDTKLLSLLDLIGPLFNNGRTLKSEIIKIRKQLDIFKKKSRTIKNRFYQQA